MLDNNKSLAPSIDIKTLRRQLKQHKEVLRAIKDYRNSKSAHADTQEKTERKPIWAQGLVPKQGEDSFSHLIHRELQFQDRGVDNFSGKEGIPIKVHYRILGFIKQSREVLLDRITD